MSAVDVGGLGRRAKVTSLSVALRGRLAPITARIGALALAVFLRPLLALVLVGLVVAVPSFLVTDIVLRTPTPVCKALGWRSNPARRRRPRGS